MKNILKTKENISKREIFDFLTKYIDEQIDLSLRQMRADENFEKAAWSEFQAHQLGAQKALFKLRELIPSSDQEGVAIE